MNNDLISREALKKAIEECKYCGFYGKLIEIINNAPTVETYSEEDMCDTTSNGFDIGYDFAKAKYERPQGKWIVKSNGTTHYYACDKCGSAGDIQDKFCRECGADMRNITETPSSCTTTNPNSVEAYHQSLKGGAE